MRHLSEHAALGGHIRGGGPSIPRHCGKRANGPSGQCDFFKLSFLGPNEPGRVPSNIETTTSLPDKPLSKHLVVSVPRLDAIVPRAVSLYPAGAAFDSICCHGRWRAQVCFTAAEIRPIT